MKSDIAIYLKKLDEHGKDRLTAAEYERLRKEGWVTANEMAKEMGMGERSCRFLIARLMKEGKLVRKGTGTRIIYNKP